MVAKCAVADIAILARMSLSRDVDVAWHPSVYDIECHRAYKLAASIVGGIAEGFPGVVDHSPNATNDPMSTKQQCRCASHSNI